MNGRDNIFIIAEAGVNHNGDIVLAKKLVDIAKDAGADAVKFQTWITDLVASKDVKMANYQIENLGSNESQYDMLKKLELSYSEFEELKEYCDNKGIMFLSTADEEASCDFLNNLQDIFKIGSGEMLNLPLLKHIAKYNKEVILSTGMSTLAEVGVAIETLTSSGLNKDMITLLHVTTQYPTPLEEVNLRAMLTMRDKFGVAVGYSDHTMGIEVPVAATALGATIIEKHFTISKDMEGPDHKASLEPDELKRMVESIRGIERALGDGNKIPTKTEERNKDVILRRIVAIKSIKKGEKFTLDNIGLRRNNGGMTAVEWYNVLNSVAQKEYNEGDTI